MRDNMHLSWSFQNIHSHLLGDQVTDNTDFWPREHTCADSHTHIAKPAVTAAQPLPSQGDKSMSVPG